MSVEEDNLEESLAIDVTDFLPRPEVVMYWLAIIGLGYGVYYLASLLSRLPEEEEEENGKEEGEGEENEDKEEERE